MKSIRSPLLLTLALLLLAAPADARRKKGKGGVHGANGTSVAQWLQPQAREGFYIRASFDTDPSAYVGRFITDGEQDISEARAMELTWRDILVLLPGANCGKCGRQTCQSLAIDVLRGEARLSDCPLLMGDARRLEEARKVLGRRIARALGL